MRGLIIVLLLHGIIYLNSCGSCGEDQSDTDEDANNESIETAILEGSLAITEVEKLMPPSTPLPEDITITSILTRSDIVSRSDYYVKSELSNSTSATLSDDETFSLKVPVDYEFITYVKLKDDVLGLVKFKKGDKYVGNITLSQDGSELFKEFKLDSGSIYDVGALVWYEDYFRAENSPSIMDISEIESPEILLNDEVVEEETEIELYRQEKEIFNFELDSEDDTTFEIVNAPGFCSLTDNDDNSASLLCEASNNDAGNYYGIILKINTNKIITILEIKIKVKDEPREVSGCQDSLSIYEDDENKQAWVDAGFPCDLDVHCNDYTNSFGTKILDGYCDGNVNNCEAKCVFPCDTDGDCDYGINEQMNKDYGINLDLKCVNGKCQ